MASQESDTHGSMSEQLPDETAEVLDIPAAELTRLEKFAQSSRGAKLSGKVNQTAGFFKRKIGEMTDDSEMKKAGRDQEFLGKVHSMVGLVRQLREIGTQKALKARTDGTKILRKHAEKLVDQATEFLKDIRDTFL